MNTAIQTHVKRSSHVPIHVQIKNAMLQHMTRNELAPGSPLPTEEKLGELFKVSRMTARKAMTNLVMENRIVRVPGKGTFVAAGAPVGAASVQSPVHNIIGIFTPQMGLSLDRTSSPSHFAIISAIERYVAPRQFGLSLFNSRFRTMNAAAIRRLPVAGLVAIHPSDENTALIEALLACGKPFVAVNCFIDGVNINRVNEDALLAGYRAARHLAQKGRKKIAYVGRIISRGGNAWQYRGYETAMRAAGLEPVRIEVACSNGRIRGQELRPILKNYDGIVAAEDLIGVAVIKQAQKMGRRVPADLAVVGFFDLDICRQVTPALSSIRLMPCEELGRLAARRLLAIIKSPGSKPLTINLSPKLIVRGSSK
ncbi:MAG: GntR family transcriptional regulator [Kiritimatiellae bacterium]|nr:GntR family transcriptional regulator [Kiritimatiellia bacterium]